MDKEELISEIRSAFDGVTLDGGVSLDEARIMDNYGREGPREPLAQIPGNKITHDWSRISSEVLGNFDCVAFLDEKGLRYYLPAFLLHILENYDPSSMMTIGTLSALYPKNETQESNLSALDDQQRKAIALFMRFLPEIVELWGEDVPKVQRAYTKYWSKYLVQRESLK